MDLASRSVEERSAGRTFSKRTALVQFYDLAGERAAPFGEVVEVAL